MKDDSVYRRLAADGNKDAQRILDEGAMPEEEMGEAESEEQELLDLEALAAQVGTLVTKASAHVESHDYARAADAHIERGDLHQGAGQFEEAADAYKDAACALYKHGADRGWLYGDDLPNLHAAHAKSVVG
jgi:hypothetical protein